LSAHSTQGIANPCEAEAGDCAVAAAGESIQDNMPTWALLLWDDVEYSEHQHVYIAVVVVVVVAAAAVVAAAVAVAAVAVAVDQIGVAVHNQNPEPVDESEL